MSSHGGALPACPPACCGLQHAPIMLAALHCACLPLSGPSGLCCLGLPATHAHVPLHCRVDRLDAEKQQEAEAAELQAAAIAAQAMQDAAEAALVARYAAAAVGAAAAAAAMEEDAGPAAAVKLEQPGGGAVKLEQQPAGAAVKLEQQPAATVKVEPVAAGVVKEEPQQEQPGGADQEMLAIRHPAVQRQNSKQQ